MAELVPLTIAVILYGRRAKMLVWKGCSRPRRRAGSAARQIAKQGEPRLRKTAAPRL